jgi:oligoendopeptidase F
MWQVMNAPLNLKTPSPAEPPVWSLDDLYLGRDDPALERDLKSAEATVAELKTLEGALVAAKGEPARLGALIDRAARLQEAATNRLGGVAAYAVLAATVDRDDPAWAKFEADVRARAAVIGAETVWLTLELNRLSDTELDAALDASPAAARWRPWLRRVRASKPHELSPELERYLADRSPAVQQWSRLWDETLARLKVVAGRETLTLNEALNRLSDPSALVRRTAAEGLAAALGEIAPVQALCLNTLAFEKAVEDRWRRFPTPAASRHLANEVDAEAVDAMAEAVAEAYPRLSHRYYALKARAMGRERLDYWDRNAPLTEAPARLYDWSEAKEIVLEAFDALGRPFRDRAETFFARPWIDARPKTGKQSGAYSHPVTADRHPYVFMNYLGERRDVLTLAHELGHAVHQTLCQPLGTTLADTPLTLAETASIFAEGLVFERLLADASPEDQRALLAGRIEDGLNTVVRQIAFHRFEARFHAERAAGELAPDRIGALWLEAMGESLGPAVTLNEGYERYWAYVSHFVHAPFYVYAYAFGDLLVSALMEVRRADPSGFAPKYEALLAAGGSKTYAEALAPFGLNPREKAFWEAGCKRLEGLIDRFAELG